MPKLTPSEIIARAVARAKALGQTEKVCRACGETKPLAAFMSVDACGRLRERACCRACIDSGAADKFGGSPKNRTRKHKTDPGPAEPIEASTPALWPTLWRGHGNDPSYSPLEIFQEETPCTSASKQPKSPGRAAA